MLPQVMLAERTPPKKEYYVAVLADRTTQSPVLVASAQGCVPVLSLAWYQTCLLT